MRTLILVVVLASGVLAQSEPAGPLDAQWRPGEIPEADSADAPTPDELTGPVRRERIYARPRAALARIASARNVVRPSPYLSMLCLKRSSLSYIEASPRCIVWLHG